MGHTEPFSSCDLAGQKDVGGLGELAGLSGVAVEFVRDVPESWTWSFALSVGARCERAGSGDRGLDNGAPRTGRIAPPHACGPGKSPEAAVAGLPPRGAQPRPVPFAALGVLLVSFPGWPGRCPGLTVFRGLPASRWWPGCREWAVMPEVSAGGAGPAGGGGRCWLGPRAAASDGPGGLCGRGAAGLVAARTVARRGAG